MWLAGSRISGLISGLSWGSLGAATVFDGLSWPGTGGDPMDRTQGQGQRVLGKGYYTAERRWPRLGEATSAGSMPGSSAIDGGVEARASAPGRSPGRHSKQGTRSAICSTTPSSDRAPFGQTELQISRQCQGTAFRHLRNADSQEGLAVLHHCLDQGVNFFDSAQAYG